LDAAKQAGRRKRTKYLAIESDNTIRASVLTQGRCETAANGKEALPICWLSRRASESRLQRRQNWTAKMPHRSRAARGSRQRHRMNEPFTGRGSRADIVRWSLLRCFLPDEAARKCRIPNALRFPHSIERLPLPAESDTEPDKASAPSISIPSSLIVASIQRSGRNSATD
jgi:hypothetical protein